MCVFSAAYRQGEDIAVGLCPDTSDPPCVGQKADLAKIGTIAQRGGNLKKKIRITSTMGRPGDKKVCVYLGKDCNPPPPFGQCPNCETQPRASIG